MHFRVFHGPAPPVICPASTWLVRVQLFPCRGHVLSNRPLEVKHGSPSLGTSLSDGRSEVRCFRPDLVPVSCQPFPTLCNHWLRQLAHDAVECESHADHRATGFARRKEPGRGFGIDRRRGHGNEHGKRFQQRFGIDQRRRIEEWAGQRDQLRHNWRIRVRQWVFGKRFGQRIGLGRQFRIRRQFWIGWFWIGVGWFWVGIGWLWFWIGWQFRVGQRSAVWAAAVCVLAERWCVDCADASATTGIGFELLRRPSRGGDGGG